MGAARNQHVGRSTRWTIVLVIGLVACVCGTLGATEPANLALHKPASSSSIENDEHNASRANDGDPDTYWCADDEPEGGPEWWQVDLEKSRDLTACQIRWPYEGNKYQYKIEGSNDRKTWTMLSDQTKSKSKSQVHDLRFQKSAKARYVRITVTGLDDGCWASIAEVKLFGKQQPKGATK